MGPAIIFDKSAFQALSKDEHGQRLFMFEENITPILLREIVTDLTKGDRVASAQIVRTLSEKFCGGGGAINLDWKILCHESLMGRQDLPLTGQIPADGMSQAVVQGEPSLFLGPTAANDSIIRWAGSNFTSTERVDAGKFRREAEAFQIENLLGRMKGHSPTSARAIDEIASIVDAHLDAEENYPVTLHWLMDQLRPLAREASLPRLRAAVQQRWARGRQTLQQFAPYAHHCARALLMLIVGEKVLSQRPTNRLDVEYLLYLPFCHLFVSDDRLHRQLAPALLRPYQVFATLSQFRDDLRRLETERHATDEATRTRRSYALGTRPWPVKRIPKFGPAAKVV